MNEERELEALAYISQIVEPLREADSTEVPLFTGAVRPLRDLLYIMVAFKSDDDYVGTDRELRLEFALASLGLAAEAVLVSLTEKMRNAEKAMH